MCGFTANLTYNAEVGMLLRFSRLPLVGLAASACGLYLAVGVPSPAPKGAGDLDQELARTVRPILDDFCTPCHSGDDPVAGLDLDISTPADVIQSKAKFEKVIANLRSQVMPPPGMDHPSLVERELVVHWIQRVLSESENAGPGRVTIRRLNRREYDNTIRDLMFVDLNLSADFPSEDIGYGFDNIGDLLTLTPLHLEQYLKAARKAVDAAIPVVESKTYQAPLDRLSLPDNAQISDNGGIFFLSNGRVTTRFKSLADGPYEIVVTGFETPAGPEHARAEIFVNGAPFQTIEFDSNRPKTIKLPVDVRGGSVEISIGFTNDYYKPDDPNPRNRDRNLVIESLALVGPLGVINAMPDSRPALIFAQPSSSKTHAVAAREVIQRFTTRAYRRPVKPEEIDRLMELYAMVRENGDSYEEGIKVAMQAVLVNPNFLFRVESGATDSNGKDASLTGTELASRLSYFLWNSMPDEALIAAAADGSLKKTDVLIGQVNRMLADPKAERFFEDFTSQWLQIRRLSESSPDPELFPNFTPELRADLAREPVAFFTESLRSKRPIPELITGKYTMLNGRLARHYGIPGSFDNQFRRVDVSAQHRGGVLGMGALLTVTSNPNRTSPVKRGKFVMEEVLGTPPPPQPPGVGVLEENTAFEKPKSMRERLDRHRADPACASCHAPLDAFGFALENFDPVGKWRIEESGLPVDSSGNAPGDIPIEGVDGLRDYLKTRESDLIRAITEKMMIYALGRGLTATDALTIHDMAPKIKKRGNDLTALVTEIVLSDQFRKRPTQGKS